MTTRTSAETELSTVEAYQQAVAELGVVGFNPHTDALRHPIPGGIRIHYYREGEVRWVARETVFSSDRWQSPATETPQGLKRALTAADEFAVIDKRTHNRLMSGPLSDIDGVHDGIGWGIVPLFGWKIERGRIPNSVSLTAVPGVGDVLAGRIHDRLYNYPSFEGESDD